MHIYFSLLGEAVYGCRRLHAVYRRSKTLQKCSSDTRVPREQKKGGGGGGRHLCLAELVEPHRSVQELSVGVQDPGGCRAVPHLQRPVRDFLHRGRRLHFCFDTRIVARTSALVMFKAPVLQMPLSCYYQKGQLRRGRLTDAACEKLMFLYQWCQAKPSYALLHRVRTCVRQRTR